LRPGIPGLSDNIQVISIVGRFLEHTRIYNFHNSGSEEFFIGSADAMTRNLEHRIEVLAPVASEPSRKVLTELLETQLADTRSAWEMQADGSYVKRKTDGTDGVGVQDALISTYEEAARQRAADRFGRLRAGHIY